MTRLYIQPRVEVEAEHAAAWYEVQQPGLGMEFILELDAAIERAVETPLIYAPVFQEIRRVLVRRFPFAVYFVFTTSSLDVLAVLHQHRAASHLLGDLRIR